VTGLDTPTALARTNAVGLGDLSRYTARNAPVLVIDMATGKRQPIWVELDSNAARARDRLLEIHPAKNLTEGHRYAVVLRNLRDGKGRRINARRSFAALRADGTPGARYAAIFAALKRAGVKRDSSLFLAWDFHVASRQSLTGRMLRLRDQTFAGLGDTNLKDQVVQGRSPAFTLQSKALTGADEQYAGRFARVLEGEVDVPCYLNTPDCGPGSSFRYDRPGDFLPTQTPGNVMKARFLCVVPATATAANPARLVLYGHGLLGSEREVLTNPDIPRMATEGNMVLCATRWAGMSSEDVPNAAAVLQDFSLMPTLADRLQQGMLNALVLGRAMAHPQGLASDALLQEGGSPIVQTGRISYDGNSQGGIMGGALTALAPDYTRAVLGVPGMNYSVLLPRSVDFKTYSQIMYPAYPDQLERPIVLGLAQILWDRGEANGYAAHMTDAPLPDTPKHTVLMQVAFGDHQVSPFQADVMARTIGARVHRPATAPARSPEANPFWGLSAIPSYPWGGSAMVYWDTGPARVNAPPLTNVPPSGLEDPHEHPRRTPAARLQKSEFLKPGGTVIDVCGGAPCVSAPDVG
jgi:hypothetical protein